MANCVVCTPTATPPHRRPRNSGSAPAARSHPGCDRRQRQRMRRDHRARGEQRRLGGRKNSRHQKLPSRRSNFVAFAQTEPPCRNQSACQSREYRARHRIPKARDTGWHSTTMRSLLARRQNVGSTPSRRPSRSATPRTLTISGPVRLRMNGGLLACRSDRSTTSFAYRCRRRSRALWSGRSACPPGYGRPGRQSRHIASPRRN